MMSTAHRKITSLRYDRALSRAVLAVLDPIVRTLLESFSRLETSCATGEATVRPNVNGLHSGHWFPTPVAVVGTSNNDSEIQRKSCPIRHSITLGPILDALRAPLVPPGRNMQVSEELLMEVEHADTLVNCPVPPPQLGFNTHHFQANSECLCHCPCRSFWAQQTHVSTCQWLHTLAYHLCGTWSYM